MTVKKILYMISYSCMKRCVILDCLTPHIGHPASTKPVEDATTASAGFTSQTAQIASQDKAL